MSSPYPIITEKALARAKRGGPYGLRRPRRADEEVAQAKGEQVRVFRVDGKHVVDHGRRENDDEQVVRASHVAIVDMSRNVEVGFELAIPSGDAKEFTVRVTFLCSVTDPVAVVRDGQGDAVRVLRGYVRSHQRLFQLGLEHRVSAVNHVRLLVQTQIEAYVQIKPPILPGIAAELASVEVLTPGEVRALHQRLGEQADEATLESDRMGLRHELEQLKASHAKQIEENAQRLDIERKKHETQMQEMRLLMERQEQHLRQRITAAGNEFAAQQMDNLHEAYQGDPLRAAIVAQQQGELSATDIAGRLGEQADRQAEAKREDRDRAWQLEDQDRDWMRQRADREYEAQVQERDRLFTVEQEAVKRRQALEDAQQALELKKLERVYALQDGDRAAQRELLERKFQSEERELERLHALQDKDLELERERLQREYESEQAKLRHQYEVHASERRRRHEVQDRDYQREVDREIQNRQDQLELLRVRLEMLRELAKHGHVDQIPINAQDVITSIAVDTGAGTAVTETAEEAKALPEHTASAEDDAGADPFGADESALQEEGLHER